VSKEIKLIFMNNKKDSYSRGDYKRLSERIRKNPKEITKEDYQMLQEFRLTYRSQLSTIFTFLNKEAQKIDKESVCTYRIKRIESIVSKLGRYKMPIYRMNDIAGCRCIMTSDKDVIKLFKRLQKTKEKLPFKFELRNNYIEAPKEDGYRSIHLIAILKNEPEKRRLNQCSTFFVFASVNRIILQAISCFHRYTSFTNLPLGSMDVGLHR